MIRALPQYGAKKGCVVEGSEIQNGYLVLVTAPTRTCEVIRRLLRDDACVNHVEIVTVARWVVSALPDKLCTEIVF